ncbi:MAG: REP-associated tyrosine transposase [Rhodanobacteraceae bacterium]
MNPERTHSDWKQRRLPRFDYSNPDHAYFVTIRALPETAPFTDALLARVVIDTLHWLRTNRGVSVYAYCLMPDHLHLLIGLAPGGIPLGDIIGTFKRFTTRQSWSLGYKGALWQSRFYDHILRKSQDGNDVVTYILANPERANLVAEEGEYPYTGCPDLM